jgi:gephyrin
MNNYYSADDLVNILQKAVLQADVIITTGGVSMGERDYLKSVIERRMRGTISFGRVALKPGKPTTFAVLPKGSSSENTCLLFGLPGNPVSALGILFLVLF